jgi:hypothetical protein
MTTNTLEGLTVGALVREASQPCIYFEGRWFTWGEVRHVAGRILLHPSISAAAIVGFGTSG